VDGYHRVGVKLKMGTWNLGSVSLMTLNMVQDVPTYLSGTTMDDIAFQQLSYTEQYVGVTIGSNSINTPYQAPILHLTIAEVTALMEAQGTDASSYRLGDLNVTKSGQSNLKKISDFYFKKAKEELDAIGVDVSYYQAL